VGRWGGDEFVAVISNTSRETAATIAERIQVTLEKAAADIDGRLVGATVSTGMAFSSHGAFELPAMLLQADQALYRAKSEGRNRLVMAMPDAAASDEQEPPSAGKMAPIPRHSAAA
jgi:diguanylate cyclase (GGDEF)-like protein